MHCSNVATATLEQCIGKPPARRRQFCSLDTTHAATNGLKALAGPRPRYFNTIQWRKAFMACRWIAKFIRVFRRGPPTMHRTFL